MTKLKKSLAIIIVLVLIILGAVGYWFYFGRGGEEGAPSGTTEEGAPEEQGFIGKIADALKRGTAMKCTWTYEGDTATFYIKGNKYRGDMTSAEGEKTGYIYRDNCMYLWEEGEKQGMKWCWEPSEGEEYTPELWGEEAAAAAFGYEYNCQPATVSDALFSLPSGIDFMDMSELMEQYMPEE